MCRIVLILLFFFISGISYAQVYKWTDGQGAVHFTDDITQVPEKYRPSSKRMELPEGGVETKKEGNSPKGLKEGAYRDRLGRGEEYWRGVVEEWKKKSSMLAEKSETLRSKYNELTEKINSSRSSVERTTLRKEREQVKSELDQNRAQLEEARNMLEKKIPEESEIYKAKPEWVRP